MGMESKGKGKQIQAAAARRQGLVCADDCRGVAAACQAIATSCGKQYRPDTKAWQCFTNTGR